MPGTFAHIALVDSLCDVDTLESISGLSAQSKGALLQFKNFCELGAVSPDYPYMCLFSDNAAGWANVMHYWKTADFIRAAVRHFFESGIGATDGAPARRCIAWLFGYAAHVVADLTVHPIVQLKVGPYEQHKTEHRVCEMNQDVYIFKKITGEEVCTAEYLRRAGIATCSDPGNRERLDPDVARLWALVLGAVDLNAIQFLDGLSKPHAAPEPHEWHRWFIALVDKVAEEGAAALPVLSRHFVEGHGVCYPRSDEVNREYIDHLNTPNNGSMSYDNIFARAQENVKQVWAELGNALNAHAPELLTLLNGNLDTGVADMAADGSAPIFWRA